MNPDLTLIKAQNLLAAMEEIRDETPSCLWEDECRTLKHVITDMVNELAKYDAEKADRLPGDYEQHNTLNKVEQGL